MFIEIRNAPVGDENIFKGCSYRLFNIIEIRNAPVGDENGLDLFIMRTPLN